MSFLPAVRREISQRGPRDPVRVVLEFLLENGVGRSNSVSWARIDDALKTSGITMSKPEFQQSVLAESRRNKYFIGWGNKGYFLIDSINDARGCANYYRNRIAAETQNLRNLEAASTDCGWSL